MTPEQIKLVKDTWAQIVPIADKAVELFYCKLFELDPELKPLFKGNMQEQGQKLMATLNIAVNSIDKLDTLTPVLEQMGKRHVDYGVKNEHYDTVGSALIWTLARGLQESFTDDTKAAWMETYSLVANTMKAAAAEV